MPTQNAVGMPPNAGFEWKVLLICCRAHAHSKCGGHATLEGFFCFFAPKDPGFTGQEEGGRGPRDAMQDTDRVWRERGLRAAVLAGDTQAWQTWYDHSFADLLAYVRWRCAGLGDLADEITQDTWLIAVRRLRAFDPERSSFAGWLRGIAANVVRNHLRGRRRAAPTTSLNGAETAKDQTNEADKERIARALASLAERQEAVLRAKYLDQRSVAEIAAEWGETCKAVESLLSRAREAFREAYLHPE
jgi:RNA polymerase sigma-70 factor (ECF subfamily)